MTEVRSINGILLLDKPSGLSSNAALQRVKKLFQAKKAGHVGTLDPLATGMLPICLGEATKFSHYLFMANKSYEVTARFGRATTTGDSEGVTKTECPVSVILDEIQQVIPKFLGIQMQIPPMYSAIKYQGKPLYHLARLGEEISREPRQIFIEELKILNYCPPDLYLEVVCSKGTYIRTLVEDIARALGQVAHVAALRRQYVQPYHQEKMLTLTELEALDLQNDLVLSQILLPIETSLPISRYCVCSSEMIEQLYYGQNLILSEHEELGLIQLYNEIGHFVGIGEMLEPKILRAKRLIQRQTN